MTPQPNDDSILLTDATRNVSVKEWSISSEQAGAASDGPRWTVTKRLLTGGRQEGVEVIEVDNPSKWPSPSEERSTTAKSAACRRPAATLLGKEVLMARIGAWTRSQAAARS